MERKPSKNADSNGERSNLLCWTENMDKILIDALLYQQNAGNRVDGTFTSHALNQVVAEVREKTGINQIDKLKIRNRIKSLKSNFTECYDLFNHSSGFAWSPVTKMFNAEEEVWELLIKANPNAKKWLTKQINHYDELLMLYAKDRATGEGAQTAKERVRMASNNISESDACGSKTNTIADIDGLLASNEIFLDNSESSYCEATPNVATNGNSKSDPNSATSPKKKKRKRASGKTDDGEVKQAIDMVAEMMKEGNAIFHKRNEIAEKTRPIVYQEHEMYAELLKIGLDEDIRYQAYDFLAESAVRVRKFFGCPEHERKNYLLHMMRSAQFG